MASFWRLCPKPQAVSWILHNISGGVHFQEQLYLVWFNPQRWDIWVQQQPCIEIVNKHPELAYKVLTTCVDRGHCIYSHIDTIKNPSYIHRPLTRLLSSQHNSRRQIISLNSTPLVTCTTDWCIGAVLYTVSKNFSMDAIELCFIQSAAWVQLHNNYYNNGTSKSSKSMPKAEPKAN